jgi:DnaJ-class molecular chaperone
LATHDPYQTLGVSKTASQDEIRNAYRSLAKKFHPDLNPGNKEAEQKFKEISLAYETIGTPENRTKYDQGPTESPFTGEEGYHQRRGPFYYRTQQKTPDSEAGGRYTFSFGEGTDEDLFQSIFGGRNKTQGEDQLYQMEIDLKDTIHGAEKQILLPSGKKLAVRVPPGVTEGTRLRFSGQGSPGIGGAPPGDAYVELHIRPDERFQTKGDDLIIELPISIPEAILGAQVRVPTLDGEVLLKVPPHSNRGTRLRLAKKGLFNRSKKLRGDQIVVIQIELPREIDPELESFFKKWQENHAYDPRKVA